MENALVTPDNAKTAMLVLSSLAAKAAVEASELALVAATHAASPDAEPRGDYHHRVAGVMQGAREAAERVTAYANAIQAIAREVFGP